VGRCPTGCHGRVVRSSRPTDLAVPAPMPVWALVPVSALVSPLVPVPVPMP
jgi:hypothetical protein